jgi:LPXTG-motif cell wall-anchored protein
MYPVLAILPEGSVKDETTFFFLLGCLVAFVAAAIFLRFRRKREDDHTGTMT